MKLEFSEEELVAACVVIVLLAVMMLGYKGCEETNRHIKWQQEHSITNK